MTILKDDHPILKQVAEPVTQVTPELRQLAAEMMATMHLKGGVGLAAPQIGESIRLIVFDCINETNNAMNSGWLFNPEIIEVSEETDIEKEGCLSYRGLWVEVERPKKIKVKYIGLDGSQRVQKYTGIAARVISHEVEHLNGITLKDHEKNKID